jgi:hypothetical protein
MKLTNVKNVKVKAQYVLDNTDKIRAEIKINSTNLMLINIAKRDGLKCDCCGEDRLHFIIGESGSLRLVSDQMFRGRPMAMTLDHDTLKSLAGSNEEENQHLLCERCNTARGNSFAEYQEFKQWFTKTKLLGKNPYNAATKLVNNFCYIGFDKNLSSVKHIKDIIAISDSMPPNYYGYLRNNYLKNGKFTRDEPINTLMYNYTSMELLTRFSEKAWNHLLNDLLVKLVQRNDTFNMENPNINFNVYKTYNKKHMNSDAFLDMIHNKLHSSYVEYKKNVVPQMKREYLREQNLVLLKQQSAALTKEKQQKVQEQYDEVQELIVPESETLWDKVLKLFKSIFS